jgi:hypothetical protein
MAEHQTAVKNPVRGTARKPGSPAARRGLRKPGTEVRDLGEATTNLRARTVSKEDANRSRETVFAKRKAGHPRRHNAIPAAGAPADAIGLKTAPPAPGDHFGTTDSDARTATDMGQTAPVGGDNAAGMTAGSEPSSPGREKDEEDAQTGPGPVVGGEEAGRRQMTELLSRQGAQSDQILGEVARALEVAEQRRMAVVERLLAQQISIQQAWAGLAQRQTLIEAQLAALVANHR